MMFCQFLKYNTHSQTMEILRRYCMGGDPVNFQIVSDQKECLRSIVSGRANYEDEFYSVRYFNVFVRRPKIWSERERSSHTKITPPVSQRTRAQIHTCILSILSIHP